MKTTIKRVAMQIGKGAISIASAVGPLLRSGLVITSIALGSVAAVPDIARADEGASASGYPGFTAVSRLFRERRGGR